MIHNYLYAVYDANNRLVQIYANEVWARKKADALDGRLESYVHKGHSMGIEMAHWANRKKGGVTDVQSMAIKTRT